MDPISLNADSSGIFNLQEYLKKNKSSQKMEGSFVIDFGHVQHPRIFLPGSTKNDYDIVTNSDATISITSKKKMEGADKPALSITLKNWNFNDGLMIGLGDLEKNKEVKKEKANVNKPEKKKAPDIEEVYVRFYINNGLIERAEWNVKNKKNPKKSASMGFQILDKFVKDAGDIIVYSQFDISSPGQKKDNNKNAVFVPLKTFNNDFESFFKEGAFKGNKIHYFINDKEVDIKAYKKAFDANSIKIKAKMLGTSLNSHEVSQGKEYISADIREKSGLEIGG